jgi:DNA-binding NtrC family response regulator
MTRVLLLDPDAVRRDQLRRALNNSGLGTLERSDADGITPLELDGVDIVLSNAELPSGNAITLTSRLGTTPLILFTVDPNVRSAVAAMQLGAADYLAMPLEASELLASINRCVQRIASRPITDHRTARLGPMVGKCPVMLELFDQIKLAASLQSCVLIQGEPGSGKELVARAVHAQSARGARPMISLNCATIPPLLIESELFGTPSGGGEQRSGLVKEADGSTIFLDEISELTLDGQARLVRMLRDGDIHSIDSTIGPAVDVRLIAATHRDLRSLIDSGRFLAELYARLQTTTLTVPPLRERGGDVVELASRLLQRICHKLSKPEIKLSDAALSAIRSYDWPGNIRELENALERAVILCDRDVIETELLAIDWSRSPQRAQQTASDDADTETSLEGYFVKYVLDHQDTLTETEIANKLGISRKSLWERRQRLNIPRKRTHTRAPRRDGGG